ncbi:ABC transporter substrate-binding protein [Conservatibacter flavescens]|uniref:ABC transporter substrate-binding protein n=1 Tax=Conservatibacter flavescens TaxID=28161 RepID=A0A2M8S0D1_9PAST|nr:ABC transporter substrate-binding protein [Conservatibacter flavescens]PJG84578.1 ABC transporter substrate-binding protein [Conservatibacter flavescens]
MDNRRRDFLKLAALFTAAGSFPLLQAQAKAAEADPNAPLKIGYLPITDATPLLVAHAAGLYEKQGLKVEKPVMFRSWSQLVEAFLSGSVNLVHLLSPMSLWAKYGSNAPVKIVMWNHLAGSALTVRPDIQEISQLSGQTVAIPFWYSIHNIVLQQLLIANGLKITENAPKAGEVRLSVMAPSDMVAALASNGIAGFIVAEPFNALAEDKGVGKVLRFSGDVWKDHACCVTLMHDSDINNRPEWVQKVVNALTEAQVYTLANRTKTAELLARGNGYTPHDKKVLEDVLAPTDTQWAKYVETGAIKHPDWHQERIGFQPYPYESYMQKLVELLQQTHLAGNNQFLTELNPATVATDLTASQFVKNALAENNWKGLFNIADNWQRQEIFTV